VASLCLLSFTQCASLKTPSTHHYLHVPFYPQTASQWCWAAGAAMISGYYHSIDSTAKEYSQCDIVRMYYLNIIRDSSVLGVDCSKLRALKNFGGIPFVVPPHQFYLKGYTASIQDSALSWQGLCRQIDAGKPVIFQWDWQGIDNSLEGGHFMVAEGYSVLPSHHEDSLWVSVHDPYPANEGKHRIISYRVYNNEVPTNFIGTKARSLERYIYDTHVQDIFDISRTK